MAYSTDIKDYWRRAWGIGDRVGFKKGEVVNKNPFFHWQTQKNYPKKIIDRIKAYGVKKYKTLDGAERSQVRAGAGYGKMQHGYPGGSLEVHLKEIKKLWLEGNSAQEIYRSNPKKFKAKGTVSHALNSMKKGLAPVKITISEITRRVTPQVTDNKIVKDAYNTLVEDYKERGLKIKPSQAALIRETNLGSSVVSRVIKAENLDVEPRSLSPEVQETQLKKSKETLEKKRLRLEKLKPVYEGRGSKLGETPKIVKLVGPEKLKNEYLTDLKKRLVYPAAGREYRKAVAEGKILSNEQLAKKYKLGHVSTVERINSYLIDKEKLKYAKGEVGSGQELRKHRLSITQPGTTISGKGLNQFHHIMPIGGEVALTSKDVAFVNKYINASMQKYNTPLNRIADAISDNLNKYTRTMDSTYLKKIESLNAQAAQIVDKAKNELPKKYRGLIGFNKITPILDENGALINTTVERIGIDEAKTVGGKKGAKVSLSDMRSGTYTSKTFLAEVNRVLSTQDKNKLSSTIQSIMNKKNSGLNIVDIAKWGSAELSALDDIAAKLPSKALNAFGRLLKGVGIVGIPLDVIPIAEAHSKGLGTNVGLMNLAEIYTNLPGIVWEAGEWLTSKAKGKEHEWKPPYEKTFGRDYETKKLQETPLKELEANISNLPLAQGYLENKIGIVPEEIKAIDAETRTALINQMKKEKALADQKKKEEITGVDKYIINRFSPDV